MIDWDMIIMMEPLTIAGAVVGSFLNVICPPWLLCIMLVLLLGATTVKTFMKGIKMYKKESQDNKYVKLLDTTNDAQTAGDATFEEDLELKKLLETERHHSLGKMFAIV